MFSTTPENHPPWVPHQATRCWIVHSNSQLHPSSLEVGHKKHQRKQFIFKSLILLTKLLCNLSQTGPKRVCSTVVSNSISPMPCVKAPIIDLLLCSLRFGNKAQGHNTKNIKKYRSSPRILLPLLRHPCRCCNLPRFVGGLCHALHWHHWHLAFLDPGSWVLPPGHGLHKFGDIFLTCFQFPPTFHPYILDLVQHHVANANEAGHSLSASGMACVFSRVHLGITVWNLGKLRLRPKISRQGQSWFRRQETQRDSFVQHHLVERQNTFKLQIFANIRCTHITSPQKKAIHSNNSPNIHQGTKVHPLPKLSAPLVLSWQVGESETTYSYNCCNCYSYQHQKHQKHAIFSRNKHLKELTRRQVVRSWASPSQKTPIDSMAPSKGLGV